MREKLRRAASVFLAFAMVVTMELPVRAQTVDGIPVQTAAVEEESLEESGNPVASEDGKADDDQMPSSGDNKTDNGQMTPSEDNKTNDDQTPSEDNKTDNDQTTPSEDNKTDDDQTLSEDNKTDDDQTPSEDNKTGDDQTTPSEDNKTNDGDVSENTLPPTKSPRKAPRAAEGVLEFDAESKYAMVAQSSGKAANATSAGWNEADAVRANVAYSAEAGRIADAQAQFVITPYVDGKYPNGNAVNIHLDGQEILVQIESVIKETKYPLRVESGLTFAFPDPNKRGSELDETFIIKKTDDGQGTLRSANGNGRYATIDKDGILRFNAGTAEENAEIFTFLENPEILDATIRFEHKANPGKYIRTYQAADTPLTVDGEAENEGVVFSKIVFGRNTANTVDPQGYVTAALVSKDYGNGVKSVWWVDGPKPGVIQSNNDAINANGWETVRILGNGDGTVSFKDSCCDQYIKVEDNHLAGGQIPQETTKEELTDNEKFILHLSEDAKAAVGSLQLEPVETVGDEEKTLTLDDKNRTQTTVDLRWKNPVNLFTGIEVEQKKASEDDSAYQKIAEAGSEENYTVTGLEKSTAYSFRIRPVLVYKDEAGENQTLYGMYSDSVSVTTRTIEKPQPPEHVQIKESEDREHLIFSWDAVENVDCYRIYEADGMFSEGEHVNKIGNDIPTGQTERVEVTLDDAVVGSKYSCYRIATVCTDGEDEQESDLSVAVSLFGDHTIIFSEDNDVKEVDRLLQEIFEQQNDEEHDAQFNGEHWQVYFKPGDYTQTSCMNLGFYTEFNGLGRTPYDVKLNNIAIPAYLQPKEPYYDQNQAKDAGILWNATCNFWRSAENLSIMNTGNSQGRAQYESWRADHFNWAVAQAAPLRRVYSERPVAYDWNYGWASGGYVADCLITGNDDAGNSAGTWGGQQFFTRNSQITGNTFGTTLNNFFMGVQAANNLTDQTGEPLRRKENGAAAGYTNWGIKGATSESDSVGGQQVVTEITNTPRISEKPFLYLEGKEYKIFVPAVQENTHGISWGEGKENEGMGAGESLSLDAFYIARPEDTAAAINRQIADGMNIYFTPGIYHAEEPIVVNRADVILLGTGMATIIPDNADTALRVGDYDGIRIEGLIFDAGKSSKLLVQVGTEGQHNSHSANPIILQDLFFRIGGTTDVLTKADDGIEINSDDVLCDHFWIWRADHGAGVEWYGNESKHGLIVNGDRVKCYALFNEHFQEYHTLWNGEDGATYFYQNETCYDPISQEAWMSHDGTVKGYSSYKVSNDVNNHYAVGLGVYNVFIYTGKTYDGNGIGIQLDNAIEVPNKPGVLVENACTQTFANDKRTDGSGGFYPLSSINHIINGIGGKVSSGMSEDGVRGEGWSRKFVLYYNNGQAEYGKEPDRLTFNFDAKDPNDQRGKFIGTEVKDADNPVEPPADEAIYLDRIENLYQQFSDKTEEDYTSYSWVWADMTNVLMETKGAIDEGRTVQQEIEGGEKYTQPEISRIQTRINKACSTLEAASEKLIYVGDARWQQEKYKSYKKDNYTKDSWSAFDQARTALDKALEEADKAKPTKGTEVYALQKQIDDAVETLAETVDGLQTVTTIAVTGVICNKESLSIIKGNTYKLRAIIQPADATNQKVEWSSSDSKKVSVDESGTIKAVETGTADITVTTQDGGHSAVCKVTVTGAKDEKALLKDKIAQCETLKETDYTLESWKAFADALQAAKETADKEDATQEEIKTAFNNLNEAQKALKPSSSDPEVPDTPISRDELNNLIAQCGTLKEADYTAESWAPFAEALQAAKGIADKENATPEEVNGAYADLNAAKRKLVKKADVPPEVVDKSQLEDLIHQCETDESLQDGNQYMPENWKAYEAALAAAKETAENEAVTQAKVQEAFENLQNALEGLKLREDLWAFDLAPVTYTGKAIKPAVTVYNGQTLLKQGKDYTVTYRNNTKVTATNPAQAVIKGKGNYSGTFIKEFEITPIDFTGEEIEIPDLCLPAPKAGKSVAPAPVVTRNGKKLAKKEYAVGSIKDSEGMDVNSVTAPGRYTVEISGVEANGYRGTRTISMIVAGSDQKLMSKVSVAKIKNQQYDQGKAIEPQLTVKYGKTTLQAGEDADYTVAFRNNSEIGVATAVLTGTGGTYVGEKTVTFKITGTALKAGNVKVENQTYTGSGLEPAVKITVNGTELAPGSDYEVVSYDKNDKAGKAVVTVKGIRQYTGTVKKSFQILPYDIAANKENRLSYATKNLTAPYAKGGSRLPAKELCIQFNGVELTEGADYTLAYAANSKVTQTASVKIKGKGNFKGTTAAVNYEITPQALSALQDSSLISAPDITVNKVKNYNKTVPAIKDLNGKALKKGTDFKVTGYVKVDENGAETAIEGTPVTGDTIRVKVEAAGTNYTGTAYADFRVIDTTRSIAKARVTVSPQTYTGREITLPGSFDPESGEAAQIKVEMKTGKGKNDWTTLVQGTDYEIVANGYSKNINKGTGKLAIHGIGEYGGFKTVSFKITARGLEAISWYEDLYSRAISWFFN